MIRALFIALVLIVLAPIRSYAQPGADEQLAAQYFQNGDYERAILYYEKLFRKQPTTFYYEQLYKSYVGLNDLESAQKLVKDQMKHNKDDPRYPVDMGLIFRKMGDDPKAEKEFDKALRMMGDQQGSVRQVANYFTSANEYDLALQAYERGQRSLGDGQNFYYEMANLYAAMGDVQKMVSAYMEMLAVNEAYLQQIQNSLSRYMDFEVSDDRTNILRTELLRRIQRDPQRTVYQELLIWMYI